jgi:hypothetical protein
MSGHLDPDRRPPRPPDEPEEQGAYLLVLPGLIGCVRCAAVILDREQARQVHDGHHAALRALWERRPDRQPPPRRIP